MSAIDSLGGSSRPPTASSGFSEIDTAEFLQIIFTELATQDPLEPQTTQALVEQLGSLRAIEANVKLTQDLARLVDQNGFSAATNLIGSLVSGISLDGRRVADLVISVSNTADGAILNLLDGSRVHINNVDEVVGPVDTGDDDDDGDTSDPTDPDGSAGSTLHDLVSQSASNADQADGNTTADAGPAQDKPVVVPFFAPDHTPLTVGDVATDPADDPVSALIDMLKAAGK